MISPRALLLPLGGAVALLALIGGCTGGPSPEPSLPAGPTSTADAADAPRVRRADFQIRYRLEGVTARSDAVTLASDPQLAWVDGVADGAQVRRGDVVGAVVVAPDVRAGLEQGADASRLDRARLADLVAREGEVVTPVGGTVRLGGAPVVESPGIDVVVGLTPVQGLRYQSLTFTGRATVETVVGERDVDCVAVWTEPAPAPGAAGTDAAADQPEGGPRLHCRLPSHVETAAGLRARLALTSATIPDATVVPNVFVTYDAASDGYVVTIVQDGLPTPVPVDVGVTDGVVRVVTSPLPVDAELVDPREPA